VMQNRAGALLVAKRIALVAGRIEGHPDGHGFLVPDEGGPSVFLPAAEMREVMHGDRAAVRVSGRDHRGRALGAVVQILERAKRRIVGRMHSEHGVLFLVPDDRRIAHDILVPPAEAGRAKAGQVVTVDLVAPPSRHAQPIGRVAEVLGHHADPGMEIEIAVRKFDLPHEFSKAGLAQAKATPDTVREEDLRGRKDLRKLPFVTVDGETARDFDDAVYCRREGKGFRLWVAIGDVSHYVRHDDALDLEARERGTSVYFPRRVIPMLPEKLFEWHLLAQSRRRSPRHGVRDGDRPERARWRATTSTARCSRSSARLTYYRGLGGALLGSANEDLQNLHAVFKVLLDARNLRGAIDFETVETRCCSTRRERSSASWPSRATTRTG
jgi:ribonuclease R